MLYQDAQDRRATLVTMVKERGFCTAVELAQIFGVSEMTVRRDIRRLAEEGLVRDVHGGVSALPNGGEIVAFEDRYGQHHSAKAAIGRAAAARISPGSVVGLDAGTTTLAVAQELEAGQSVSVVTVSVPTLSILAAKQMPTVILGGVFRPDVQSIAVRRNQPDLDIRIDELFLSASAVIDGAVYTGTEADAITKQALIAMARRVTLVADSSKFVDPRSAMFRVVALSELHAAITDTALPAKNGEEVAGVLDLIYAGD